MCVRASCIGIYTFACIIIMEVTVNIELMNGHDQKKVILLKQRGKSAASGRVFILAGM